MRSGNTESLSLGYTISKAQREFEGKQSGSLVPSLSYGNIWQWFGPMHFFFELIAAVFIIVIKS